MALNKKSKLVILVIGILILLSFIILKIKQASDSDSKKPQVKPAVVVTNPSFSEMERNLSLTGDVLPTQQANIFAKVSGNIERVFVDIGGWVKQNQILALIDTTIYSQNVRQARAAYLQAEANFNNAKINLERNKSLFEQKLISQQDLDNSNTNYQITASQKEASLANLKNTLTLLDYCRVRAPFSGVITKRYLDAGAYVSSSTGSSSSILFSLMDISVVKVNINVPEKQVYDLNSVKDVSVKVDALQHKEFKASIKKINQALDMDTRTMVVEVDINNKDYMLKPGMFATVRLLLEKKQNTMVVPLQSVIKDDNGEFVYKLNPDSTVNKSYVKTGISNENYVEVVNGLSKDERIVVVGQNMIRNNMKVRIAR